MASKKARSTADRSAHVGRSQAQRRAYVEKVVRGVDVSSTAPIEAEEAGASTSSPLPTDDDRETVVEPSAGRRRARQPGFFEKHRQDLFKGCLVVVFSTGLAGIGWLAFSLNREVGEQKQTVTGVVKTVDEVRDRLKRTDDRVESISDSLHAKLDRIRDLVSDTQRTPPNPALQRSYPVQGKRTGTDRGSVGTRDPFRETKRRQ